MSPLRRLNRLLRLRYRLEYVAAVLVVYGVRCLSPDLAWGAARAAGRLAWRLGIRRKVVLANLAVAFPDLDAEARERLGRRTYEHFGSVCVDILFQRRMISRASFHRRIDVQGWARRYLDEHGEAGLRQRARRVLFLTAHLGNWELSSGVFSLLGVKIAPVFRMPQNPYLDGLLRRIRLDSQSKAIEKRGAVAAMLDHVEAGGNVGILFDQEAVFGMYVPFFGLPACTHKTPAVLARDHGLKVFFGVLVRKGDYLHYEARGEMIDYSHKSDDRQRDLEDVTTDLMRRLETEIRRNPEQYMWMHRRWKRVGVHGESHARRKLA